MSKKEKETKKSELPNIPNKYVNVNKIEETEQRIFEDYSHIDLLKKENFNMFNELKQKETDFVISTRAYEKLIDEKTRQHLKSEEELNKVRIEKKELEKRVKETIDEKLNEIKVSYNQKITKLTEEVDNFREKYLKNKTKKKNFREEAERAKNECNSLSNLLQKNIESYEQKIVEIKEEHVKELEKMRKREEEFIKSNEELMDTDIYTVYKEVKSKFEQKIAECLEFRGENERISDENKLIKMNLDNNDDMIKQCAELQINKQKLIKNLKSELEDKTDQLNRVNDQHSQEMRELNFKLSRIIDEKNTQLKQLKLTLSLKAEENIQLRTLSQIILDQRSEIEQYFIESLEEVKIEVYKRKKEAERKGVYFPNLNRRYEDKLTSNSSTKKLDIKELLPEDKEKVLRLLFSKINDNYKPKSYKSIDLSLSKASKSNIEDIN